MLNIFLLSFLTYVEICGRDRREPIYRVKAPKEWKKMECRETADTKKPIAEWVVSENGETINITLHNFPTSSLENRIAPIWQINRWKKQFDQLGEESFHITPVAFGGFSGLFLEAQGLQKGEKVALLAWAMQLADEHFRQVTQMRQMCADYTIKIIGSPSLIEKYKGDLLLFANSFELIDEIPEAL